MSTRLPRLCVLALAVLLGAGLLAALAAPARAQDYGVGVALPFSLFPADNAWNTRVDDLPLDPDSAGYIAHMDPSAGLHPDFGTVWDGRPTASPTWWCPATRPRCR